MLGALTSKELHGPWLSSVFRVFTARCKDKSPAFCAATWTGDDTGIN